MSVAFFAARRARLQDRNQAPPKTRHSRGIEEALNGRPTSCGKAERYFGDCVSRDGAPLMDSKWMSPSACERYAPLLGPNSSYDEVDPSCTWRQGDGRSKSCQYLCYYDENYGISRINYSLNRGLDDDGSNNHGPGKYWWDINLYGLINPASDVLIYEAKLHSELYSSSNDWASTFSYGNNTVDFPRHMFRPNIAYAQGNVDIIKPGTVSINWFPE